MSASASGTGTNVHEVAQSGFSQGTNDLYDRARPSYPASALQTISKALPKRSGPLTLLEPGSGTGIFTRLLLHPPNDEYPEIPIKTLIGIEPSEGMRATWQRSLSKVPDIALEGRTVKSVEGSFDDFSKAQGIGGVDKGKVDGVLIAQAYHWCPNHDKALREIASYLSSGSPLILIWNIESNAPGWFSSIRQLYEPLDKGSPQYYRKLWRAMFDEPAYKELFEEKEESTSEWSLPMTEDQLVERLLSKSYLTEHHLNGQARTDFIAQLRKLIREGDKQWVDKEAGTFLYRYNTDIVVMKRK